jgi:hypothetical protein
MAATNDGVAKDSLGNANPRKQENAEASTGPMPRDADHATVGGAQ